MAAFRILGLFLLTTLSITFVYSQETEDGDTTESQKVEQVFQTLDVSGFDAAKSKVQEDFAMGPTEFENKLVQKAEFEKASEWNAARMEAEQNETQPTTVPTSGGPMPGEDFFTSPSSGN